MSSVVSNYIKIMVPTNLVGDGEVQARIDDVTKLVGGVTTSRAHGEWFDDAGVRHVDDITVVQWNFATSKMLATIKATHRVVSAMWDHGEKAVMRERQFAGGPFAGYKAEILYAK